MAEVLRRLADLEGKHAKDSHNSPLPPSSDRFVRQPKSLRKKSGKRSGGQEGHPGTHLQMVSTPDQIVLHAPTTCSECQHDLSSQPVEQRCRRQAFDLLAPTILVCEHQAQSKRCPRCYTLTAVDFPCEVTAPTQYGPAIASIGVYLSQNQLLPDERVCQVMSDLLGVAISGGSLHNWIARCALHLAPVEEQIKEALQQEAILHQDETGLYVAGKQVWMHIACTSKLTHYAVHAKRWREAMDAIGIAAAFTGTSIHDGWASYQGYLCAHALCNVHHLRELIFVHEERQQEWAAEVKDLLLQMKEAVEQAKARGEPALSPPVIQEFEAQYGAWLRQAEALNPLDPAAPKPKRGRQKQGVVRCLIQHLRSHQDRVLAFLHDFAVPFDNSQAERDIRMVKVQQKVSGCFRSQQGAEAFCRIRGYLSTMHKQGHHLLSVLEMALVGHPLTPAF